MRTGSKTALYTTADPLHDTAAFFFTLAVCTEGEAQAEAII